MTMRLAFRSRRRRADSALLAVGALALGEGCSSAVCSLVRNVLLEGLRSEDPHRLVTPDVRTAQGYLVSLSVPSYRK